MNSFSIDRIVFVRKGDDPVGDEYSNYKTGRGVCGLVVLLDGYAEYEFSDGRKKILSAGEMAVFSHKTAYTVRYAGDRLFSHYTVNFALSEKHSLPADETYLKPKDITPFVSLCEKIISEINKGHPASNLKAMSCLYLALSDIYSDDAVELSDRNEYISILPAVSLMESDYGSKITLNMLAQKCLLSVTSFRRIFKNVYAVSPMEYLLRIRMSRAKALLKHTHLSVNEIARECGFADTEHFCRTFKLRFKVTASQYRNKGC